MHGSPGQYVVGLPTPARCLVMGVVNVTPDSFSDGGRYLDPGRAREHGRRLAEQGADLVDVGGESTRPGARRPAEAEELARVLPVVRELAREGLVVSVDTMRASVAQAAVEAGARLVNDVSGGLADPAMLGVVARLDVPCVLMHWRAHSAEMATRTTYAGGVVPDVVAELRSRLEAALEVGIDPARVALDPGIGFAKTAEQNWDLLSRLDDVATLGRPLLVATSRKRFLGSLLADEGGELRAPAGRDDATTATTALAAAAGAWCVRVHSVRASADAVRVVSRWAGRPRG